MEEKIKKLFQNNGLLLKHYNQYNDNKELVLIAVKNCAWSIHFASERLKNDKDVILQAVKKYGIELHDISLYNKNSINDKEIVFEATTNNYPNAIIYASKKLLNDINFLASICLKRTDLIVLKTFYINKEIKKKVIESIKNKISFKIHQQYFINKISYHLMNLIYLYL